MFLNTKIHFCNDLGIKNKFLLQKPTVVYEEIFNYNILS
jgi:hypothetical protein